MTVLALRTIGIKDYAVIDEGHPVGRIRLAAERHGEVWMWNCTVLLPGGSMAVLSVLKRRRWRSGKRLFAGSHSAVLIDAGAGVVALGIGLVWFALR